MGVAVAVAVGEEVEGIRETEFFEDDGDGGAGDGGFGGGEGDGAGAGFFGEVHCMLLLYRRR